MLSNNALKYAFFILRVAIKQFKSIIKSAIDIEPIQREIDILKMTNNEFILKYLDSFYIEERSGKIYYLITQYYPDKTLHHLIRRKLAINEPFNSNETIIKRNKLFTFCEYNTS